MKIGFLDSGIGGWSVLRECLYSQDRQKLTTAHKNKIQKIIYLADFANLPYGNKSLKELSDILDKNLLLLESERKIDLLVLACNTSSSLINQSLKTRFSQIKIIDLITETEKYLFNSFKLEVLKKSELLIFCTKATKNLSSYQRKLSKYFKRVNCLGCKELAGLIEEYILEPTKLKELGFDLIKKYKEFYLNQNPQAKIDFLLLGCTHYPILFEAFQKVFQESMLINPASAIKETLNKEFLLNFEKFDFRSIEFLSTDPKIDLRARVKKLDSFLIMNSGLKHKAKM